MSVEKNDTELNEFVRIAYEDLHRIAARHLRSERSSHTLQPTALLNEVYLKLANGDRRFSDRTHFLAVASRAMRQVLVDYARTRGRKKRGEGKVDARDDLSSMSIQIGHAESVEPVDILELNRAIDALAKEDESLAQIIEMRYFGGMRAKEIADIMGKSINVVRHDLRLAQAWLRREIDR
jgi:RNA polymerase sigma-70 factor (ECF subfamily)